MITSIILLSLLGTVIAIVIGSLWYSPGTPMGKIHMRFTGFSALSPADQQARMAAAKPTMWKLYLGQTVLSFLMSLAVVTIVTMSMQNGVPFAMAAGFVAVNWLCFMVPALGASVLWSDCEKGIAWPKFLSDITADLLTVLLIALAASLFV